MVRPIYHELSKKLEDYIRENNITGKLPGTRTLSEMFNVHHVTLSKALHLLEDKGIIKDGIIHIGMKDNAGDKSLIVHLIGEVSIEELVENVELISVF